MKGFLFHPFLTLNKNRIMYENLDDSEFLMQLWQEATNAEDFLQSINDERPYLYEEGKQYLLELEGANHDGQRNYGINS